MIDLTRHPRLLWFFSFTERAKNSVLRRNRGGTQADRNLAQFYDKIWRDAAEEIGAEIEDLGFGVLEIRLSDAVTRVQFNTTALDDLATHCIARTKPTIYKLLERDGLPIPRHLPFGMDELGQAAAFLDSATTDCVVKPGSDSGGGAGVTTGIRTRWQLALAAKAAARHSSDLLIEEQIPGDNYRLLYLDGELLDAVVRFPPRVVADGKATVLQLVQAANEKRLREGARQSHGLIKIDQDMQRTLAQQDLSLASVPKQGKTVTIKTATNENSAHDNVTVRHLLHDSVIAAGARAAALARVRLAGVDVLTTNPSVPLEECGGVILEVNNPPGFYWHYHKRDGCFPLAVPVLRRIFEDHTRLHDSHPTAELNISSIG